MTLFSGCFWEEGRIERKRKGIEVEGREETSKKDERREVRPEVLRCLLVARVVESDWSTSSIEERMYKNVSSEPMSKYQSDP